MPGVRYVKVGYAAACLYWIVRLLAALLSIPAASRNPNPWAAAYCLAVAGALPAIAGYFLLFKILPRIGRAFRTR